MNKINRAQLISTSEFNSSDYSSPAASITLLVRIIREKSNRDGWIGKDVATGKVCFFTNLDQKITKLEAGQRWNTKLVSTGSRYNRVELITKVEH